MAGDQASTWQAAGGAGETIGDEMTWKAPAVVMAVARLAVVVPGALAALRFGYPVLGEVIAADELRSYLLGGAFLGLVIGGGDGWAIRRSVAERSHAPDLPVATPAWAQVIGRWRPRLRWMIGVAALVWLVAQGGVWLVTFYATYLLANTVVSPVIWVPGAVRWEAATGRTLLIVRLRGGRRGLVATLPAAEVDAIVSGDLGGHEREHLLGLFASLHNGGRYDEAAALGDHLYARWGEAPDAYNTACSLARAGDHDLAVEYLGEALRGGFGRKEMVDDKDLAPLLPRPDVMELYKATRPQAPALDLPSALDVGAPPGDGLAEGFGHWSRLDPEGGGSGA